MDLYEILYRWNLWGDWQIEPGQPRQILQEIVTSLEIPEVLAIIGPRRAGKSTVTYQLMDYLLKTGADPKSILHINFEEPALSPLLQLSLLDDLYNTYRARIYPTGKCYIFLDEIQNVPEWERWVRARNETEDIKIIVTGSSSQLLSRELGTLLTGRHLIFEVLPLNFSEILQFRSISLPNSPFPQQAPPEIQNALLEYLQWGGFPRIVLTEQANLRERLLTRYFEDILYKDIIMRHDIRDVQTLRSLAVYLLTNTASLISYKRLCNIFNVSQDLIQSYCQYLQEAFLFNFLSFYTLKASERIRKPYKCHAIDLGLRKVVSFGHSPDSGKLVETLIHREILDKNHIEAFYWIGKGEIDLALQQGLIISDLIQTVYSGLENPKVLQREISSLLEAGQHFPKARKWLLTFEIPKQLAIQIPKDIQLMPIWQYLLHNIN